MSNSLHQEPRDSTGHAAKTRKPKVTLFAVACATVDTGQALPECRGGAVKRLEQLEFRMARRSYTKDHLQEEPG